MTGNWEKDHFSVSTDSSRLQLERIHAFLSTKAYWCLDIPKDVVERAIAGSLCFGLYDGEKQIGFARVISDGATFAYLADVYVEEEYRGHGLSKWMMECVMEELRKRNFRRICLSTKDAHGLYTQFGFEVTKNPGYWMEIKDNDLYRKMKELRK